ncbi:MAG: lipopolysaccharide assembly protein LapB [Parashewanella sp.]
MLEVLFLLLPIAAGYGWYMGRRSIRQQQSSKRKELKKDYFAGLNFLLSNESDKAVDLFINMLDVDDETIDTHLSLGALFRKRGEVDRAIRIHQNLIARPNLLSEQLEMAMMELGKDYISAGFYDRAEEILLSLLEKADETAEAEEQLRIIYQTTKEWQKAIDVIKSMSKENRIQLSATQAHYYCQLADESDDDIIKLKLIKLALKSDANCGRALLELANLCCRTQDHHSCKQALYQLIESDIELLADCIKVANIAFTETDDNMGYISFLQHALQQGAGVSITLELVKQYLDSDHSADAESILLDTLHRQPTMKGFQKLTQIHAEQAEAGSAKQSLTMLEKLVEQQIKFRPSYRCRNCGFPSHGLYWQCPSCKGWGTIKRIKGLDGE